MLAAFSVLLLALLHTAEAGSDGCFVVIGKRGRMNQHLTTACHQIVKLVDEFHTSDADEERMLSILSKFVNKPSEGTKMDALSILFFKLQHCSKKKGLVVKQSTNYYKEMSLLFTGHRKTRFEVFRATSKLYRGKDGVPLSDAPGFFGILWDDVKEGVVRDQIFAFGRGLAKGTKQAAVGTIHMILHPVETVKGMVNMVAYWDDTVAGLKEKAAAWLKLAAEDPVKFAEQTGNFTGHIEFALVGGKGAGLAGRGMVTGVRHITPLLRKVPGHIAKVTKVGTNKIGVQLGRLAGATRRLLPDVLKAKSASAFLKVVAEAKLPQLTTKLRRLVDEAVELGRVSKPSTTFRNVVEKIQLSNGQVVFRKVMTREEAVNTMLAAEVAEGTGVVVPKLLAVESTGGKLVGYLSKVDGVPLEHLIKGLRGGGALKKLKHAIPMKAWEKLEAFFKKLREKGMTHGDFNNLAANIMVVDGPNPIFAVLDFETVVHRPLVAASKFATAAKRDWTALERMRKALLSKKQLLP